MNKGKVLTELDGVKCTLLDVADEKVKMTPKIAKQLADKISGVWDYVLDK